MKTISLLAIIAFLSVGCENRADPQRDNNSDHNDTIMTEDMDMNNQGLNNQGTMQQDTMNMDTHPNTETRPLDNNGGMNESTDNTTNSTDTITTP